MLTVKSPWHADFALVASLIANQAKAAAECEQSQWQEERLDFTAAMDQKIASDSGSSPLTLSRQPVAQPAKFGEDAGNRAA